MAVASRHQDSSKPELLLIGLALAFGWIGAVSLALQRAGGAPLAALTVLSVLAILAHLWLNRVAPGRDLVLLPVSVALTAFGLLSVARVAPNFQNRQLIALCTVFAAFMAVTASHDRLRWLRRFKYTWLIAAFALLIFTLVFGVNPSGFGARLWLSVAGLFVQPSELLRLLVIAFLAAYFAEQLEIREWKLVSTPHSPLPTLHSLAPALAMWLVALVLLLTQQDLGAASLLLITYVFMLYLATGSARLPLLLIGALAVAGGIGYFVSARVAQRLDIWLNPWADPQGNAFQVVQSLIAVASGGVFGQGINQGRPDYVPAVHTDFPFVMVGEEFGLLGALGLIACFALLSLRGWRIALTSPTAYRMLLAGGLSVAIAVQVFVIIGGNLGLLPLTGITLPMVSYGGTSLLVSYIMIALLIRLSADGRDQGSPPPVDGKWVGSHHPQWMASRSGVRLPVALRAAKHAAALCAASFGALALATGFWGAVQAQGLTGRDDNPRRVEAELAIARGPIYARDGAVLARSVVQSINNNVPRHGRVYPAIHSALAIGYYSQRYGTGGMEGFADAALRGKRDALGALMHRPQVGTAITTTIDVALQRQVFNALHAANAHAITKGAAVVINWRTGEVLALVSVPSFDPNTLDDDWERLRTDPAAPLVNRATQGLYQPGSLLQWLIETQDAGRRTQNDSSFISHLSSLQLHQPVSFELPNEAVPLPASATYSETVGQGALRVTPLRVATTVAEIAAGQAVTPTLMEIRDWRLATSGQSPIPQGLSVSNLQSPFMTFAQIGTGQHVGWLVTVESDLVIVVVLEQSRPDEAALRRVAETVLLHHGQ